MLEVSRKLFYDLDFCKCRVASPSELFEQGFYPLILVNEMKGARKSLSQTAKKPLQVLQRAINRNISVRIKSDLEYRGRMINVDPFMNVILEDAGEYSSGTLSANYGKIVIRGNNVIFIRIEDKI